MIVLEPRSHSEYRIERYKNKNTALGEKGEGETMRTKSTLMLT